MSRPLGRVLRAGIGWPILVLMVIGGCARPEAVGAHGRVRLIVREADRHAQYLASDLRAFRVTVRDSVTAAEHVRLLPAQAGGLFRFGAFNLPVGQYTASVEALADTAGHFPAGQSLSAPFTVLPGQEVAVSLPPLILASTPIGDWQVRVNLTLASGYSLSECRFVLSPTSGAQQASTTRTTELTWGQVPAFPSGLSTTSVQVTAKKGKAIASKTLEVTVAVAPGATVSSTVNVALP